MKTEHTYEFHGHIVHCVDLDSRDEFFTEVLINKDVEKSRLDEACIKAAKKHPVVEMSCGNTFDFEYMRPSGKVIRLHVTKERTEVSPTNAECLELLNEFHHG